MAQSHQVAIVTGAARGIGRAIGLRLASTGAAICVNYAAHADAASQVASEVIAAGGRAIVAQADVADPDAVTRMVGRAESELGPITILVNNAGVGSGGIGSLDTFDPTHMSRMRAVNADGVIHTVRAVAPGMKARGYGRIVNIASNAAIGSGLPGTTFYAASKAEVLILTRRFTMELGRFGITVNAVAPGWIVTDMTRSSLTEDAFAERVRTLSERAMVGRAGHPDDIATPQLNDGGATTDPDAFTFADDGAIPNSKVTVLVYCGAVSVDTTAIGSLFARNGRPGATASIRSRTAGREECGICSSVLMPSARERGAASFAGDRGGGSGAFVAGRDLRRGRDTRAFGQACPDAAPRIGPQARTPEPSHPEPCCPRATPPAWTSACPRPGSRPRWQAPAAAPPAPPAPRGSARCSAGCAPAWRSAAC